MPSHTSVDTSSVRRVVTKRVVTLAVTGLLALTSCVDGPATPLDMDVAAPGPVFEFAPVFSLTGPNGAAAQSLAQAGALDEAFSRVNRFRVIVRRVSNNEVVVDVVMDVTPGADQYDFTFDVSAAPNETFTVTLTAFEGETELFASAAITVTATPTAAAGDGSGGGGTTSTPVTLAYSGPGVTATSVEVSPTQLVLAPARSGTLTGTVLASDGTTFSNVPLGWVTGADAVATVVDGTVAGVADGLTQVTVTTPTGLQARAWVYVVAGELAYVSGGSLQVRGAGGGDATTRGGGASAPAWSPDGGQLYHVSGGSVQAVDGAALVEGGSPSVSPDGTKFALERSGRVFFANIDGTNATAGPSGSEPVWDDASSVLVSGGSIQRVRADDTGRSSVADGAASAPARSSSGTIAYVRDGELHVVGRSGDALLTGVTGRPSWSTNGSWLVVAAGGALMVVPVSGEAPGAALPGLDGATDPAFKPSGTLASSPEVRVTGFDPAEPSPGEPVRVLGSGFDWIIPLNNTVVWPTRDGATETSEVTSVTETSLTTMMPRTVGAGHVRVETRTGTGMLAFEPMLASIEIKATTPWDAPVSGVVGVVTDKDGVEVARGETDERGALFFPGLTPGEYNLAILTPDDFVLQSEERYAFDLGAVTTLVELELLPVIRRVTITPEKLELEVGQRMDVTLEAFDGRDAAIPEFTIVRWVGGAPEVGATGEGLSGIIVGLAPSTGAEESVFVVSLNTQVFEFPATVTSFIEGTIRQDPDPVPTGVAGAAAADVSQTTGEESGSSAVEDTSEPGRGYTVEVRRAGADGAALATATSEGTGRYKIPGLFAGTYDVIAPATENRSPVPDLQVITLDVDNPSGVADWFMTRAPVAELVLDAGDAMIGAIEGTVLIDVTSLDADGNSLGGRRATFNSLDPSIATVADSNSGVVTAVTNGTATIEVTVEEITRTISITVDQVAVELTILCDCGSEDDEEEGEGAPIRVAALGGGTSRSVEDPAPDSIRAINGEGGTAGWEAFDANGYEITHKVPTFTSDMPAIMTVDAAGTVAGIGVGRAVLTVEMDGAFDTIIVYWFARHVGNLDINVQGDLDAVAAAWIGEVTGNINIAETALTNLNGLQTIFLVDGSMLMQNNASLTDVTALFGVRRVGGDVVIENNDALLSPIGIPPSDLREIDGDLVIAGNRAITHINAFDSLRAIHGDLVVIDNDLLDDDDLLAVLEHLDGDVYLRDNPLIASTGLLPLLTEVHGAFIIEGGGAIVGSTALTMVNDALVAGGDDGDGPSHDETILTELHFPNLACTGNVIVYSQDNLTIVDLVGLDDVGPCYGPDPAFGVEQHGVLRDVDLSHRAALVDRYGDSQERVDALREATTSKRRQRDTERATEEGRVESEHSATQQRTHAAREALREQRRDRDTRTRESDQVLTAQRIGVEGIAFKDADPVERLQSLIASARAEKEAARQAPRESTTARKAHAEPSRREAEPLDEEEDLPFYGDLVIWDNPLLTTVDAGSLRHVEGFLGFAANPLLETLAFPLLESVGYDLVLDETNLTSISFPALLTVGSTLVFERTALLETVAFPLLEWIGDDLDLYYTDLTSISFPALLAVGDDIDTGYNPLLTALTFPLLETVGGDLFVEYSGLVTLSAPALLSVGEHVEFSYNDDFSHLVAPLLHQINGDLKLHYNSALTDFVLESLRFVDDVHVHDNTWASSLRLPVLENANYDIEIYDNTGLGSIEMGTTSTLAVGDDFYIDGNAGLHTINMPGLAYVYYDIDIDSNDDLLSIDLATTTTLSVDYGLSIHNNALLQTVNVPGLEYIGDELWINDNPALISVDIATAADLSVDYGIYILHNAVPHPWTLNIPGLINLPAYDLNIADNDGLESVTVVTSGPTTIASSIRVHWNPHLKSFTAPSLTHIGADYHLHDNPLLEVIDTPTLTDIGGWVQLFNNGTAGSFSPNLPTLATIGGGMDVYENPGLETLRLDALTSVGEFVNIYNNPFLSSLSGDALVAVDEFFRVSHNPVLPSFSFSSLEEVRNHGSVDNNDVLTTFNLGALASLAPPPPPPPAVSGPGLAPLPSTATSLYVFENPALTGFDLHSLAEVGVFNLISNPALTGLPSMPSLGPGTTVAISDNALLTDVAGLAGLPELWKVDLNHNPAFVDASGMSSLETLTHLLVVGNDILSSFVMPGLTHVWTSIDVSSNPTLATAAFPALFLVGEGTGPNPTAGLLKFHDNPLLASLDFSTLTQLDGPLDLMDNEALPDLDAFSALASSVYAVLVNDNDMLTDVSGLAGIGDMELIGHVAGVLPPFVADQFAITNNVALCVESVSTLIGALLSKNSGAFALSPLYAGNKEDCGS